MRTERVLTKPLEEPRMARGKLWPRAQPLGGNSGLSQAKTHKYVHSLFPWAGLESIRDTFADLIFGRSAHHESSEGRGFSVASKEAPPPHLPPPVFLHPQEGNTQSHSRSQEPRAIQCFRHVGSTASSGQAVSGHQERPSPPEPVILQGSSTVVL